MCALRCGASGRALAAVREGPQAARDRLGVRAETGIALQALGRHAEAEGLLGGVNHLGLSATTILAGRGGERFP
jgi:hypothetical protein